MKSYIERFCSVLKSGLLDEPIKLELSLQEMRKIWKDAEKQATIGLISSAFLSIKSIPVETSNQVKKRILSIAGFNLKLNSVLKDSITILNQNGIYPILLKGQGVASYYNQPLLRECGDIDFYVGTTNYKKSFDLLNSGFDNVEEANFEEKEKHSHLVVNNVPVELHQYSDILPRKYNARYQAISDSCLAGNHVFVKIGDIDVRTPEPTFNAFFIFNHLWRHFIAVGVGFRQICDWVVFLHANKDSIDLLRLEEMLNSLDLMKPWRVFGIIAVNRLSLPKPEMPFYDYSYSKEADKVLEMIMKEGNFGHEREDRWEAAEVGSLNKLKEFFIITKRYLKVLPMFPNHTFQEYKMRLRTHLHGNA